MSDDGGSGGTGTGSSGEGSGAGSSSGGSGSGSNNGTTKILCTATQRMLLEARRETALELYRRADALMAEAVHAVLLDHGQVQRGRRVDMDDREGRLWLILSENKGEGQ
jgi:hypothetical protein